MTAEQQLLERLRSLHARTAKLAAVQDGDGLLDLKMKEIDQAERVIGNLETLYLGKAAG